MFTEITAGVTSYLLHKQGWKLIQLENVCSKNGNGASSQLRPLGESTKIISSVVQEAFRV